MPDNLSALDLVLTGDPALFAIVRLALVVSLSAVLLAALIGVPLGTAIALSSFRGRDAVIVFLNAMMGLPPVVIGLAGYTLAGRGTWLSFQNKGELAIVVQGDKRLFNQYGVILVNPARHPHIKKLQGQQFIDWLVAPEGQSEIGNFRINGQPLFFANAGDPDA